MHWRELGAWHAAAGLALLTACGRPSRAPAPAASSSAPSVTLVGATVLANGCSGLGAANAKLAESAMSKLVEGCDKVPGGAYVFVATLLPTGRIEIAPAAGQPAVVPICVLKHELRHRVALRAPCTLDVRIEEQAAPLPAR